MLYLIGLGLNTEGISLEGKKAVEKCKKIYLEGYTVDFPYDIIELEKVMAKKIEVLDRTKVEDLRIIQEAKKEKIALLVYGSPLFATTHTSLIEEAKKEKVQVEIIYSASVFDAIAESGLQLYKFGKITSLPAWKKNYEPDSFMEIVKKNRSIKAHSLILVDIGLSFEKAKQELKEAAKRRRIELGEVIICSRLGGKDKKISYDKIEDIKEEIKLPFCIILPSDMHFAEKEAVEKYGV